MRADGIDVDNALRQGSFTITKGYPLPGAFVPDRMVNFLQGGVCEEAAKSAGYSTRKGDGRNGQGDRDRASP